MVIGDENYDWMMGRVFLLPVSAPLNYNLQSLVITLNSIYVGLYIFPFLKTSGYNIIRTASVRQGFR